jgi:hypothetical protein
MFSKILVAAAVVAFSGAAYADGLVYQGGPKTGLWTRVQSGETGKPYAQYVPTTRPAGNQHIYQGGPNTAIPHPAAR